MTKVYCNDCVFYDHIVSLDDVYDNCEALENKIQKDTWKQKVYKYNSKPKRINKNNDCAWYQRDLIKLGITKPVGPPVRKIQEGVDPNKQIKKKS